MDWLVSRGAGHERRVRVAAWFLALSYGLGAPVGAFFEFRSHTFSERFDLPAELIYLTCAVQFACSIGVLLRPFALWAAAALTVTTLGAIASHLKIATASKLGWIWLIVSLQLGVGPDCLPQLRCVL